MEKGVVVKNLSKVFKTKIKEEGVKGSLKSFIRPKYKEIAAVDNISFTIDAGELVAFIGPNGAGKSTTLKMLSGILFPDDGTIRVMGINPQKERMKLAYRIGTVFGQKPQLWFHLPAIDSFHLFSKIYELDEKEFKKRLSYLVDRFQIQDILNQPVRKLSLGQRMRCEFVLALLHKPDVLFLDEPTIGLDVTVKKVVRELIKKVNQEEGVTIILTSHDMGDVEDLCKRAIIINKGTIVYDGSLDKIKKEFIKKKIIKVVSSNQVKVPTLPGVTVLQKRKYEAELEIDTQKHSIRDIIERLMNDNQIEDITIEEPPIEEIIGMIYHEHK